VDEHRRVARHDVERVEVAPSSPGSLCY
jgi:hypothetical protein